MPPPQLQADEVRARIADAARTGEVADLRGTELIGLDLDGIDLCGVVLGCKPEAGGPPPAVVRQTSLRGARLRGVEAVGVVFEEVNLRGATLEECDLRYALFRRTTFHDATLSDCDLYRAVFETGVVFGSARLTAVSLERAILEGTLDLRMDNLRDGLLQEDEQRFAAYLRRSGVLRAPGVDEEAAIRDALRSRHTIAARTYRGLSGVCSAQGAFADASHAYRRSRRLERAAASPRNRETDTSLSRWVGLWLADVVAGFGDRVSRPLWAVVAIGLLPAVPYGLLDGVRDEHGRTVGRIDDLVLFSVGELTTSTPDRLHAAARWVEVVGQAQTLLGITLLGLLGFVLGNRIRQS